MLRKLALLSALVLTPACFVVPAQRTSTSRTVVVEHENHGQAHSAEVHERNEERKEAHEERKEEKKEDHDHGKKP